MTRQPGPHILTLQLGGLVAAVALALGTARDANWDLPLLAVLLVFAVVSDLSAAVLKETKVKISGSFLALVLAMVLLGGAPAALIGVATILIGWLRWREAGHHLLNNMFAFVWFPLAGGLLFDLARDGRELGPEHSWLYLLVFAVFAVALALNFVLVVGYLAYLERASLSEKARRMLIPVLPSELAAALLAVLSTYLYVSIGLVAIAFLGLVLVTFQHLLGGLLLSQERAEQLELRTEQLATAQVGLLGALLHSLDLRDRMTARHSAAVARYAREIARASGLSERDQELVHTAGLLHDIGKFVLSDRVLKANEKLSDEDWELIKSHPAEGAAIVSQVDGYEEVADIILAHHERIDGTGYPHRLAGAEIPRLSRIISVADTYDVMTARDSYRKPVPPEEAIAELRRVAGAQLDAVFVEAFVEVLHGRDVRYRHGEDADFDAEIAREKHHVAPGATPALAPLSI